MESSNSSSPSSVPLLTGLNAHRAPQPPLRPPSYVFSEVPKANRDLSGSILQEVKDRDHFKACMSEMVLLCNEAIRRNALKRCTSKPLSLEYIADRLDVDDPCFGYLARSQEGKLQGFITLTTFTNWQKNFRWDSKNEASFYYDSDKDEKEEEESKSPQERSDDEETVDKEGEDDEDDESYAGEDSYHTPITSRKRKKVKSASSKKQPAKKQPKQEKQPDSKPLKRARKIDLDGSLAQELENTVRLGDPYNEGIVWPRVAEVSLLGALGCGKQLLKIAIEQLEFQKPTAKANYDYLVLQATDNSIGFYESMGFVRVGAVTFEDENKKKKGAPSEDAETPPKSSKKKAAKSSDSASSDSSVDSVTDTSMDSSDSGAAVAQPLAPSSPEKNDAVARPSNIVSSPLEVHVVQQGGWAIKDIAARHKVDPWDIVFLNHDIFPELTVNSKLKLGTNLFIPKPKEADALHASPSPQTPKEDETPTKWFVAKENDTPRKIAKMYGISCNQLVQANVTRLPGLQASARLKEGTRVKVNNFDKVEKICEQYCHWSFPDDASVENGEPSYMMVYKVERKTVRAPREVRNSLAVKVQPYEPPPLLLEAPPTHKVVTKKRRNLPKPPVPPPKPPSGINVFRDHQKQLYPELREDNAANRKIIKEKWDLLSHVKQTRYENVAKDCAKHFDEAQEKYRVAHAKWKVDCERIPAVETVLADDNLFNKVVKLRDDALEGKQYTYWYVLTYIPDLKWCHLAPMVPDGVFGPERKRSHGRTRWRLVDETLGHELDVSSMFCIPVRSRTLRKTADADKEEWDVLDDSNSSSSSSSSDKMEDSSAAISSSDEKAERKKRSVRKQPIRPRSAIKPMSGKIAVKSSTPKKKILSSPAQSTRSRTNDSPRTFPSPRRLLSPGRMKQTSNSPTRHSGVKRKATQDLDPERKARTIKTAGGRRSVLQS